MKRKNIRIFGIFVLIGISFLGFGIHANGISTNYDNESPSGVHLGFINQPWNSMTVSWWTQSQNTDTKVYYGLSSGSLNMVESSGIVDGVGTGYIHNVELKNLLPATTYFYKCGGDSGNSSEFNFTTAPSPKAKEIHFVAIGDSRSNWERRRMVADMILKNGTMNYSTEAELVIHSGDIVSSGDEQDLFDQYHQDLEPLASHIPVMYVAGNHEIGSGGSVYPRQFKEPGNGNEGWFYSFNWGPVHFIGVDSESHGIPIVDAMDLRWLDEDLRRANQDNTVLWIVVWFHKPPFVSFSHEYNLDIRSLWCPMFEKYNVDVVFNGHCHAYQRNYPVSSNVDIYKTGDPYYVNPPYPIYIVSGAAGVNSDGETQSDLRNDAYHAKWNNSAYGPDGNYVFFDSNHFANVNITVDESTNKTKLWMDVIGLNTSDSPTESNYSVYKVDEMSITKDVSADWYDAPNGITYTGYNFTTGTTGIALFVVIIGVVGFIDVMMIIAWRKARNKRKSKKD